MDMIHLNSLWLAIGAVTFLPKLHEVDNYSMDRDKLNNLRLQETLFVGTAMAGGILAAMASKKTAPFGIAAVATFIIVAVYEAKANGYEVS
jgi:hypothetical protein